MKLNQQRLTKNTAFNHLSTMGFQDHRVNRAIKLYERNYAIYNIKVIKEIIYRLSIKDKMKTLKRNTYYSRVNVVQALQSMSFHQYHIDLALKEYEIRFTSRNITYNMQKIIELLMKLRTNDGEHIMEEYEDVRGNITATPPTTPKRNKIPSHLFENAMIRTLTVHGDNQLFDQLSSISSISISSNAQTKRKYVEKEIISTEKSYLNALNELLNELIIPMFDNKYIERKYFTICVSSIPLIIAFHAFFLNKLIDAFKHKSLVNVFREIMSTKREEFIAIYLKYVTQYDDILDLFGTTFYGNNELNKFISQKRKEKKALTNYLILPVQRVPRYILLLKELKNNTDCNNEDYLDIDDAIQIMTEITLKINQEQKRIENHTQCLQIQKLLNGLKHPIIDKDNIERQFEAQFILIKKDGKRQRQFFIFNDILIITNKKYTVKHILEIRTIDIKYNDDINEFTLITQCTKPIVFIAKSINDLNQIQKLIKTNRAVIWDLDLIYLNGSQCTLRRELVTQQRSIFTQSFVD